MTKIPVNHKQFLVLGFFSRLFRRPQNSNSGGHTTSIFIDNVHFTLHPWIILIDTNTNAKEQEIYLSVSIQKRVSCVVSGMEKR